MNRISLEDGRAIAERILEEALARLDVANFVRSDTAYGICEIIGLTMRC